VFSYVDQGIRKRLVERGQLVTLDRQGQPVDESDPNLAYVSVLGPIPIPRDHDGKEVILQWYPFVHRLELNKVIGAAAHVAENGEERFRELLQSTMSVNSVLACAGFDTHPSPLVRLHSCCMTGDVFGSQRCECGPQLENSMQQIMSEGGGALVYMSGHEGRGIGLWAKAITYLLQDEGEDTYQANVSLGLPEDSRDFGDAAVVLRYLRKGQSIRLLSNNPLKQEHLEAMGQTVEAMVPLVAGLSDHNKRYMESKRSKGHLLPDDL